MGKERAGFSLDDDLDIGSVLTPTPKKKVNPDIIKEVAEKSGFTSRQPRPKRGIPKSPFTVQNNLKSRPRIKDLFQEVGCRLKVYDHTTFERAILALIEKEGMTDLLEEFREITE